MAALIKKIQTRIFACLIWEAPKTVCFEDTAMYDQAGEVAECILHDVKNLYYIIVGETVAIASIESEQLRQIVGEAFARALGIDWKVK